MAFLVQTDPPADAANSYVSVADFQAYCDDRSMDYSASDEAGQQSALVKATQYLDVRFKYVGYRKSSTQQTEWPRSAAYNSRGDRLTGIPVCVQHATIEYAFRALTTPLLDDPERDASGQVVKTRSETVGPISERIEMSERLGFLLPAYPLADALLTSQGIARDPNAGAYGLSSGSLGRS